MLVLDPFWGISAILDDLAISTILGHFGHFGDFGHFEEVRNRPGRIFGPKELGNDG